MINYSIFPYWLGVNNGFDLFAFIIGIIVTFSFYIIFGGAICPNDVTNKVSRMIFILFWPLFICLGFLLFPIRLLYEFSKPAKQQEAEFNEFIKNSK